MSWVLDELHVLAVAPKPETGSRSILSRQEVSFGKRTFLFIEQREGAQFLTFGLSIAAVPVDGFRCSLEPLAVNFPEKHGLPYDFLRFP